MTSFRDKVGQWTGGELRPLGISVLQTNLGYRCNMACRHCHVMAGPGRNETMDAGTAGEVLRVLAGGKIPALDLTGGAPELNPNFRSLVEGARGAGCSVMLRTNLTVFFEDGMEYLPGFLAGHGVEIVASLPCYTEGNADQVRGPGSFSKSVSALRILNSLGYGSGLRDKRLTLVYNPAGAFLPPSQKKLEEDYRRELLSRYGLSFDALFTFSNMAIGRFRDYLSRSGGLEGYEAMLASAFNPDTIQGLMCRRMVSVGWDGGLYDCDFNQILGLAVGSGFPRNIRDFDYDRLLGRAITVGDHCFACTAGAGST